jgi:lipopolysaccharide/colanic/teichoic acid biosynthesis glycosyltransferase
VTEARSRHRPGARRVKRAVDLAVTVPLALLLAPVLAGVWVAMTVSMIRCRRDRGGWIYRERRISRGREFGLLKFRTLRREALRRMREEGGHARQYEDRAENLTWAGRRILKPWYLDELPQLVNVLRGEMTLVGPRPWPPEMVSGQVEQGLDYRLLVAPGWTGPAQVSKGARGTSFTDLDLEYVERLRNDSGWRLIRHDLRVLRETVRTMRRGEGLRF